ncbi:protein-tyrosine phosphatase-like protein [Radiomyces spectabilis]|uniref:protein-tyrosine phosphatase-like protein n=1 Tax=Radiomyces spectabilis TaxID=64574 RepID=UPI00221F1625|nr:protein-tyrosine phosphatase-like protein [Radiomyces spectabilis]KAI8373150.1 protein-tyrosine phosphatase-like protein [Radiomyces spectabilis]
MSSTDSFSYVNHSASSASMRSDDYPGVVRPSVPKTSISHPINISWIIAPDQLPLLCSADMPERYDLFDLMSNRGVEDQLRCQLEKRQHDDSSSLSRRNLGNLALSSCPGKKVRLSGPVRGRAAINRDLELDFNRMRNFGITMLVCCLNDEELEYLGASWPKYVEAARRNNLQIVRLPMIEGGCPNSIEEMDAVIQLVNAKINKGENVLTHCRGGVGRAGLFACCWLLERRLCFSAQRAITYLRVRRSPKAIETLRQAEFAILYCQYCRRKADPGLSIPPPRETGIPNYNNSSLNPPSGFLNPHPDIHTDNADAPDTTHIKPHRTYSEPHNLHSDSHIPRSNPPIHTQFTAALTAATQTMPSHTAFFPAPGSTGASADACHDNVLSPHLPYPAAPPPVTQPLLMLHTDHTLSVPSIDDIGRLEHSINRNCNH